jgi:CPA1 family monovalent cation:H+ antiporter
MTTLLLLLGILAVATALYELARRIQVPYPTVLVIGGLALAVIPGLPRVTLEPDLVLLVFLPPLLFSAAFEMPLRDLRASLAPIVRLSVGLVLFTMVAVGTIAHLAIPGLGWPAALALGAIVAPTDALAATALFRRLGAPRIVTTLIEGESLFNDATALVAFRAAVAVAIGGAFVPVNALLTFVAAGIGGIAIGIVVGRVACLLVRRLDDPPAEVAISIIIPFAAYLPAELVHASGVLAAVSAGLIVGRGLGSILSPDSSILWLTTWKMIGFLLNGFVFLLLGLQLPEIVAGIGDRSPIVVAGLVVAVSLVVIAARFAFVYAASFLPGSPRRVVARRDPGLAWRLVFLVSWSGLRGAVSLAAALALPAGFPERNLLLIITFGVILVTLVGQGLTLPTVVRRVGWDGIELEGDEASTARAVAYRAGLDEIERVRPQWPTHQPLLDRLESGLRDRTRHLATEEDPDENEERRQERLEHEEIQRGVIEAQRVAVIELRDQGAINDLALRDIERDLDLEQLRMEG